VASVQSFTLWHQATIEFTRHDHFIIVCPCHLYIGVVLCTHSVRGEPRFQRNANEEVATTSPPFFSTNHTNRKFFLWKLHKSQPSHPGHSTILLRPKSSSGVCAELHTVAASNNKRVHRLRSLLLLVRTTYIWVLFFACIAFMVNNAFSAMPVERLQHQQAWAKVHNMDVCLKVKHLGDDCWLFTAYSQLVLYISSILLKNFLFQSNFKTILCTSTKETRK